MCLMLLSLVSASPADGTKVLEGFEDAAKAKVTDGQLASVKAGEGITEGKQAGQLPPGATVSITVSGAELQAAGWLKIDSLPTEPSAQPIRIAFNALAMTGYVGSGKDTLALPLTVPTNGEPWPNGDLQLRITNLGSCPLVLDNIRLEAADEAPKGAVLVDFGPGKSLWPGFASGDAGLALISFAQALRDPPAADSVRYPDPLTGSYYGPVARDQNQDTMLLRPPTTEAATAWLWLVHYGYAHCQPLEWGVKADGQPLAHKKLAPAQMMGPAAAAEGCDGDWSAEWFDTTYASHFVTLQRVAVPLDGVKLEMLNCQVAAMVVAPNSSIKAATACVDQVQKDLSRFRRQFMVAQKAEVVCDLAPSDEEIKQGGMLFVPPADEAYSPFWRPTADAKVKAVKAVVAAGGVAVSPLVVVPLKKSAAASLSFSAFATDAGKTLAAAGAMEGFFLEPVARVRQGRAEMQPWLLSPRDGDVPERSLLDIALVLAPPSATASGVYKGTLKIVLSTGRIDVPIEVEVLDVDLDARHLPVLGSLNSGVAWEACPTMAGALGQQDAAFTRTLRTRLRAATPLGSVVLPAPAFGIDASYSMRMHTGGFDSSLANCPPAAAKVPTLIDCDHAFYRLETDALVARFNAASLVSSMVAHVTPAMLKAGMKSHYYVVGHAGDKPSMNRVVRRAGEIVGGHGEAAAYVNTGFLSSLEPADLTALSRNVTAILLQAAGSGAGQEVAVFKKQSPKHAAYVSTDRPDRYGSGFYARGMGADGSYVGGLFQLPSAYNGFWASGAGLLAPAADGSYQPTIRVLALRQAMGDYAVMAAAEDIARRAGAAKVDSAELEKLLGQIRQHADKIPSLQLDAETFHSASAPPSQMEAWRESLTRLAAAVAAKLPPEGKAPAGAK
jgi:hypothetical protein